MVYPKEFSDLKESFKLLPGVGDKSAERYVYAIDEVSIDEIEQFAKSLLTFKKNIKKCNVCGHYSSDELCLVCSDDKRDKSTICVVEDSKSVFTFENSGNFKGLYHVLGNLISPIDDINPEDINLSSLVKRVKDNDVSEVIIAIAPSVEGETTSLYIQKILEDKRVKVSRLSYGIPMGGDIEYLDPITLTKAIEDRKIVS